MRLLLRTLFSALFLQVACSVAVDPSNPYDPGAATGQKAKASVRGKLEADPATPLSGVSVTLSANNVTFQQQLTVADGSFVFSDLPPDSYVLGAAPQGYVPLSLPVKLGAGENVDLKEVRLSLLTGAALGTLTGTATLGPKSTDNSGIFVETVVASGPTFSTQTNQEGAWSLSVAAGAYTLRFSHKDFKPTTTTAALSVTSGALLQVPPVALAYDPATVIGVVDGELPAGGSAPLADATVTLDNTGVTGVAGGAGPSAGTFSLTGIPAGSYVLRALKPGYEADTQPVLSLAGHEVRTLTVHLLLKLARGGLTGTALVGGSARGGVAVQLGGGPSSGSTLTAADGTYAFAGLLTGAYSVTLSSPGYKSVTLGPLTVAAGAVAAAPAGTLVADPSTILGHVEAETPSGGMAPLANATVSVDGVAGLTTQTNVGGDFSLQVPMGSYVVRLSSPGYGDVTQSALNLAAGASLALPDPFQLALLRGAIAGTVTLPDSADASGIVVELAGTTITLVTGQDGRYLFSGLIDGTYQVTARHDGYQRKQLAANAQVKGTGVTNIPAALLDKQGGAVTTAPYTASRVVALSLNAPKADSYLFSEDPAFADPALGDVSGTSTPHAFGGVGSASFQLTDADGEHTVYVTFFSQGVPSSVSSANTILDRSAPTHGAVVINSGSGYTNASLGQVNLSLVGQDLPPPGKPGVAVSGVGQMRLANDAVTVLTSPPVPFSLTTTWALDTPSVQGQKTVCAVFIDNAGNESQPVCAAVIYDTVPPSGPSVTATGGAQSAAHFTNTAIVSVTLAATDANGGVNGANLLVRLSNTPGFTGAVYQPFQSSLSWLLPPGDGAKAVYAQFLDAAGNASLVVSDTITLDTVPPRSPALSITEADSRPANGYTNNPAVTLDLSVAPEPGAAAVTVVYSEDPSFTGVAPTSTASGVAAHLPYSVVGDGLHTIYARFFDLAGNASATVSASVVLDRTGPSAAVLPKLSPSGATSATAMTLLVPGAGQDEVQIAGAGVSFVAPAAFVAAPSGATIPFTLTSAEGMKAIAVTYRDLADNTAGPLPLSIVLDRTSPVTKPFTITGALADGTASTSTTAGTAVTLDLSSQSDALSGVAAMKISNSAGLADANWQPFLGAAKLPWILTPGDGVKTVYLALQDAAGNDNLASPSTGTITLRTQAPTAPSLALASQDVNSLPGWSDSATVAVTVNAASGPVSVTVSESPAVASGQSVSLLGKALPYTFPVTLGGTGARTLYARFFDSAGNSTSPISASITVDTTAPTTLPPALSPSGFTSTTAVVLTPPAAGQDWLRLTGGAVVAPSGFVAATPGAPINVTLSAGDGVKSITVTYRDNAGNTTTLPAPLSITLEATPPVATNFNVWGTYADGSAHLGGAVAQAVQVDLHAEVDPVSGTSMMRLGALSDVSDGVWVAYAPTSTFTVSAGNGLKTIYAQFLNGVGQPSNVVQGTVTLDTTATVKGTVLLEGVASGFSGTTVSVSGTALTAGTAGDGSFTIASVPSGTQSVVFAHAGYVSQTFQLPLAAGVTLTVPQARLALSRGGVTGTINLPAGAPSLSGTLVQLLATVGSATFTASTDSNGNFSLSGLPTGNYNLSARHTGYLTYTPAGAVSVAQDATTAVGAATLSYDTGATLTGVCTANGVAAGAAQAGSGIAASGTDFNGAAFSAASTTTGSGGTFTVSGLRAGSYTITCSRTGFVSSSTAVSVAQGATASLGVLAIGVANVTVAGTVSLSAGGLAGFTPETDLSGIAVTLTATTSSDLPQPLTAITGAGGAFSFPAVPFSLSGTAYKVAASARGYLDQSASVSLPASAPAQPAAVPLVLSVAPSSLAGRVTLPAPSASSANVTVSLSGTAFNGTPFSAGAISSAAASGNNYGFGAVPAGAYTITFAVASYQGLALSQTVPVPAGSGAPPALAGPSPTLTRASGSLTGTLALAAFAGLPLAGADLAGVLVTVTDSTLAATYGATTDSNGSWSISGIPATLPANPAYTVVANKQGFFQASGTATVASGANAVVSLPSLAVAPTNVGGPVALVNPQPAIAGNRAVTATLTGVAFNGAAVTYTSSATSAPGSFSLPSVPAGNFTLTLTGSSSYKPVSLPLVIGAPPATPATPATLTLAGQTLARAVADYSGTVQPGANGTGLTLGSTTCASSPATDCSGISVLVTDSTLGTSYGALTDTFGRFYVTGVPLPPDPSSAYTVTASKSGYVTTAATGSTVLAPAGTALAAISLPARSDPAVGCVLVPPPAADSVTSVTATLSGTAFNGTAYTKSALVAADVGNVCHVAGAALYTFSSVADGTYAVTLARPSFQSPSAPGLTVAGAAAQTSPLLTTLARATGTLSGTVSVTDASLTGLAIGASERANALVTVSGADLASPLSTVTDGSGKFVLSGVPVNVTGTYSVAVSKSQFTAGAPVTGVSLAAGSTTAVNGLTLSVTPATLTVTAELHDFILGGDAPNTTTAGISISVAGTAFNGAAVTPSGQVTNTNAQAIFASLPSGTYSITATYPGSAHTTGNANGVTLQGGAPAAVTVKLNDTVAPTAPAVAFSNGSPTSATLTNLSVTNPSTDPTLPVSNLWGYQYRRCDPTCGAWSAPGWNGAALPVALPSGQPIRYEVFALDYNGNQSQVVSTTTILSVPGPPSTPQNVRVDNRPGSIRISWDASTPYTGLAPVAGYKVYYGPVYSFTASDYNGANASQGPSPVYVANGTELTLTALPNSNPFYVAVSAFDGVADPGPNESAISAGIKANPNLAPIDRTVRLTDTTVPSVPAKGNSLAAQRDTIFVSGGSAGAYQINTYQYDAYGTLTAVGSPYFASPNRANTIVADVNRTLYVFDPTAAVGSAGSGLEVLDARSPGAITSVFAGDLPGLQIDHLIPAHRGSLTTTTLHGLVTYADGGGRKIATFSDFASGHLDIGTNPDADAAPLVNQLTPADVAVAGPYSFVLGRGTAAHCSALSLGTACWTLDGYTLPANFTTAISNTSSVGVAVNLNATAALVVDWPYAYFSVGNNVYAVYLTASPLTMYAPPVAVATLRAPAQKMIITGGLLLVGEDPGYSVNVVEAFSVAGNGSLTPVGTYETNVSQELPSINSLKSMVLSGANLFMLIGTASHSALDVAELGGPRYLTRLGTASPGGLVAFSAVARGSRALAVLGTGFPNGFQLHDIDMHGGFSSATATTKSNVYTSSFACSDPQQTSGVCNPIAVYGDYAFVVREPGTPGAAPIDVYDVGYPDLLTGAPIATMTATAAVTGLAAGNGYLVASVESAGHSLERFDFLNLAAPSGPVAMGSRPYGRSVDLVGQYAWVGTSNGFCTIDIFSGAELACTTIAGAISPIAANGVYVDAGRLYTSQQSGSGAGCCVFQFQQYDVTTPGSPALFGASFGQQLGSVPVAMVRTGPYLIGTEYQSSVFEGVGGFVLSSSSSTPPKLVGTAGDFASVSGNGAVVAGPYLLVPDQANGLAMIRMY